MESLVVRRLCHSYLRQLKTSGQSWRQLCTLNNGLNIPQRSLHLSTTSKVSQQPNPKFSADGALKQLKSKKAEGGKKGRGPGLIILAISAVGFATLYYINRRILRQHEIAELKKSVSTGGEVLIGGDWTLINQDGKTMTNKDFHGDWCIIYFGFTHCPDICPDEIEKIVEVTDILERNPKLPKLRALFITVDPERDSAEAIKTYLEEFSDKLIGLTGTLEQLRIVYRGFKVYYSVGPKDEDGDYIVDHSIISYLMNPDGKYEAHFPRSQTNVQVANVIEKKMNTWASKSR